MVATEKKASAEADVLEKAQPPSRHGGEPLALLFDTANETIACGIARLDRREKKAHLVASAQKMAHRASNTQLIPIIDDLLHTMGASRENIACVVCGKGPGSFTGVRIAMATAKGVASALARPLVPVSSLDAVAWEAWARGVRGRLFVVADAMRHEIYPAWFALDEADAHRESADRVVKAEEAFDEARLMAPSAIAGDALAKYGELFSELERGQEHAPEQASGQGSGQGLGDAFEGASEEASAALSDGSAAVILPDAYRAPTARGLMLAFENAWREGSADPFDFDRFHPMRALPAYTRLSDAEENERTRIAKEGAQNLATGVDGGIVCRPLSREMCPEVAALESAVMGTDAWSENLVADELGRKDRIWWCALSHTPSGDEVIGYAGGWVVDGELQILKVGVAPAWRRRGIARELLARVSDDARNLGAERMTLEVRRGNEGAQKFYENVGMSALGVRPRYYSDGEDACIMQGTLLAERTQIAGMDIRSKNGLQKDSQVHSPLILAIETSCDETAAAVIDGEGRLLSDVVASQIDFHARFGGVVPEIASRKHIEAISGVCEEGLAQAHVSYNDLNAIAVTYAPGLVGALVVGVAFAKGAAWALDIPLIGVNHLEGHLYANKLGDEGFAPPAVVSLVSGGNTMLVFMKDWGDYETLGSTIDDAVGEAFDKVAKALGLGYPGGPVISRLAEKGDPSAIDFPRAMLHSGDLRFSLSGLKTAVITYIQQQKAVGNELNLPDIAASFQQAVIDVQIAKAARALSQTGAKTFCLGGGVAANPALRRAYEELCAKRHVKLVMPPLSSCGDNAGMIALVALDRFRQGKFFGWDADAYAHASLDEPY